MSNARVTQVGPKYSELLNALHSTSFSTPWSSAAFTTLLQQPGVTAWVCEDTEPTGFILVRAVADEGEILTIAVAPAHRRQGVGKRLLNTAHYALRSAGIDQFFLEVGTNNLAALELYRNFGFAQVGTRTAYYRNAHKDDGARNSTDAMVMSLRS
jgi:ribosomal-protein-alanine N-acetyltransferase